MNDTQGLSNGEAKASDDDSNQFKSFNCTADRGFSVWVANSGGSLAVSTYQAGRLLLIGWLGKQLSLLPRQFSRPMGLDVQGDRLVLATHHEITSFYNSSILAQEYLQDQPGRYDALFLPRITYHTADLQLHDLALTENGIWFVNTSFSCLAQPSPSHNFVPRWKPDFISELAPEDRCHLNGLAMDRDEPAFVTALCESNQPAGWREHKVGGGIVIDVRKNRIITRDLAMPHSPRLYRNALWVLNSGYGQLLRIDPESGKRSVICELPGYLRGLTFVNDVALIGLCQARETKVFGGMPVESRYDRLKCGVALIDLKKGAQIGWFEFTSGCSEIYDIRFLPGKRRPNILSLEKEAWQQAFSAAPDIYYWMRPKTETPSEQQASEDNPRTKMD